VKVECRKITTLGIESSKAQNRSRPKTTLRALRAFLKRLKIGHGLKRLFEDFKRENASVTKKVTQKSRSNVVWALAFGRNLWT